MENSVFNRLHRATEDGLLMALLAIVYLVFAYLGLAWAMVAGAGSPVWPAAGVGLAGLLLFGVRFWPAIFIGRVIAGLISGSAQPFWVELTLGAANTLGTVLPVIVLHRLGWTNARLASLQDVGRFLLGGAALGALIAGSIGTLVVSLANNLGERDALHLWFGWTVGNFAGGLVLGPLILAWADRRRRLNLVQAAHLCGLTLVAALLSAEVFFGPPLNSVRTWHLLPVLVWAALAFEVRGAATVMTVVSGMAVWATQGGFGPFIGTPDSPLPLVQQFISVTALTTLLLATITDERRAREMLRQREERVRSAVEASGAGTFRWRFGQDFFDGDVALLALLGVEADRAPRRLDELIRLFHPEDRAHAQSAFDGCVQHGDPFFLTARIGKGAASGRIIQGRGRRIDDADGVPDYVTGAFVDVTERHRLEQRLLKAEETYRAVFEQAGIGVARLSLEGTILEANDRFCEIIGQPLRALLGNNWAAFDSDPPPQTSRFPPPKTSTAPAEKHYARGGTTPVWVEEHLTLVSDRNGSPVFYVAIVQDVTERKQAEQEVRLRAEEMEVVLREVPAAIWFAHDSACTEVTGNSFSKEILRLQDLSANMSKSAPDPSPVAHFQIFDQEGQELAPEDLPVQRAARGEIIRNFEERVTFVDGSSLFLLGNASPLLDPSGNVRGAVAAFIDITDRKRSEAREQLLSREVDHRAKNVLAIVQAIVQLTQADTMAGFRRMVAGRIQSLARTHTLLAESRWEGVDLHRLVTDELAPIALTEAGKIDATHFQIKGPSVWLKPAATQALALVVHELVTNAVKYGGLSSADGHVSVVWNIDGPADARQLHLSWTERGKGVAPADPPEQNGFGWTVIRASVEDQLGGVVTADWATTGLSVTLELPLRHLSEGPGPA